MQSSSRQNPIQISEHNSRGFVRRAAQGACSDPIVGAILSGWRYDLSALSPAMRKDYDLHMAECSHCRSKQRLHRTVDVLLISVSTLSIVAFFLAAVIMHRVEAITHIAQFRVPLGQHAAVYISLEAVAIAGLFFSTLLWILVAIATPLPGFLGAVLQQRMPENLRQRFSKDAA
jgi:hypothetical protein